MNSWLSLIIGIALSVIGFSNPGLWPWLFFCIAGGGFIGKGAGELARKHVDKT